MKKKVGTLIEENTMRLAKRKAAEEETIAQRANSGRACGISP